jgi:hypothetical protein
LFNFSFFLILSLFISYVEKKDNIYKNNKLSYIWLK